MTIEDIQRLNDWSWAYLHLFAHNWPKAVLFDLLFWIPAVSLYRRYWLPKHPRRPKRSIHITFPDAPKDIRR